MTALAVLLLGTVFGVSLAVAFAREYPLVPVDAGIISVCAVVGCLLGVVVVAIVRLIKARPDRFAKDDGNGSS